MIFGGYHRRWRTEGPLGPGGWALAALLLAPSGAFPASHPASSASELPVSPVVLSAEDGFRPGAWPGSLVLDSFLEISPADNIPARVATTARLLRDGRALHVSIELNDPEPARLRAPFVDRDRVFSDQDFVQLEIDSVGDGRTSRLYRVNPRGVQGDGIYTESTGADDFSPDFPFESWARQTPRGWVAVFRIPLASLASPGGALTWRVCVYRNYPREFRYQFASNAIPRGSACWLCHALPVAGEGFEPARYLSVAPYMSLSRAESSGAPGPEGAARASTDADAGVDLRWKPGPAVTLDGAFRPDFSHIESDVVQLDVNERFALRYPEKRPFFMEGADLLATRILAAYTRSISAPRWGLRATGLSRGASFAVLVAEDRGGGSVVIPGSTSSDLAAQDFQSTVGIGRLRRPLGPSVTAGALVTGRWAGAGGRNWVLGPDLEWRPNTRDQVVGQGLFSFTRTPDRPDLYTGWDGRTLRSMALDAAWNHSTDRLSWSVNYWDYGAGFRSDTGFVPQVDQRGWRADGARAFHPSGAISLIRPGVSFGDVGDQGGTRLEQRLYPTLTVEGRFGLVGTAEYHPRERTRVGARLLRADFAKLSLAAQPHRRVPKVAVSSRFGDDLDVVNGRVGRGGTLGLEATIRPDDHLGIEFRGERQWLDVSRAAGEERLFTAHVLWLKATYSFDVRAFLRVIAQHERIRRDARLYAAAVDENEGGLEVSALFGYRANWRTVFYLGYGEVRTRLVRGALGQPDQQAFFKLAYELGGH